MYERQFTVTGTVVSSGLGVASTGTEQIAVLFEYVKDGEPRRITWYGSFTEKGMEWADKGLAAIGWDPVANTYAYNILNGDDPATNPIIGKKAKLVLDYDMDLDGNDRLKVKFVNSLGGGLGLKERMSAEDAQGFAARMRARAGGAPVSAPKPKPAPAAPATKPAKAPMSTPGSNENDWGDEIAPF